MKSLIFLDFQLYYLNKHSILLEMKQDF